MKNNEKVKDGLLKFLGENYEVEETEVNTEKVIKPGEAVGLTKNYEEIIMTQHKRVKERLNKRREIIKEGKSLQITNVLYS